MLRIEHIGIAVEDLARSIPLFEKLLNTSCYKTETVETEQVRTAFFRVGESKVELLESTAPGGVIARFLEKRGPGMHHIAFETADLEAEMRRLMAEGFEPVYESPRAGADNKRVCFLKPKGIDGVLVELCQDRSGT